MTLRHMKLFLAVYQTENITRAAEQLHMTQPAVTRAIQEIEAYYGVRLFERINRKLYVTETGKVFYTYALHIVDSFDQMEKRLRNWDELGVLRVGASITNGNALLPKVLVDFARAHPTLRVKSTISNGASLQKALLNNQLDFAVMEGGVIHPELQKEAISKNRLVPVLPPNDPRLKQDKLTMEDFAQDAFLLRDEGSMGRKLLNQVFAMHGMPLVPSMESVSTQAIVRAVHAGLGISFLPESLVRQAIAQGYVGTLAVEGESFTWENYMVWHRHKFLTKSITELMDCFRRAMPEGCEEPLT